MSRIDRHISARIRERRIMLGITQQDAAATMGVTYQQFRKYETGINRISAGRLYGIAKALGVDATYFFDGLAQGEPSGPRSRNRMLVELARNFSQIAEPRYKDAISAVTRALAKAAGPDGVQVEE
jgi:transcriptional regulator with XRE-family HTH domain